MAKNKDNVDSVDSVSLSHFYGIFYRFLFCILCYYIFFSCLNISSFFQSFLRLFSLSLYIFFYIFPLFFTFFPHFHPLFFNCFFTIFSTFSLFYSSLNHFYCSVFTFFYGFQKGYTPLIWASGKGHCEIVSLLINMGCEVDKVDKVSIYIYYVK